MALHRGKIARNPTITAVRALTRDDLMLLNPERKSVMDRNGTGVVARLRDPHHRLARLIAAGLRTEELIERTGYSATRIWSIQKDPSFIELVATYRGKVDAAYEREIDEQARAATSNMRKAETMLAIKLEEAEESGELLPTRDLIAITADRMDRFGYGKRQTNMNVNVDFAASLEKARARSAKPTYQIEATPLAPVQPQYPQSPAVPARVSSGGTHPPLAAAKLLRRI